MTTTAFTLDVQTHADFGRTVHLGPYVRRMSRTRSIYGQPGTWSASLEMSSGASAVRDLHACIRDGDWVTIRIDAGGRKGYMLGVVDRVAPGKFTDSGTANVQRQFTIGGRDWGRMLSSETRISTILALAKPLQVIANDTSDSLTQEMVGLQSGSGALVTTGLEHPTIPGIIDERLWDQLDRYATDIVQEAWKPLKMLVQLALYGAWHDPSGAPLLSRMSWDRFGSFGGQTVRGEPWQLPNVLAQRGLTPYALLEGFGNPAFNEAWHDYVGEAPAIVYRPRPYSRKSWQKLMDERAILSGVLGTEAARSGAERYNYYLPAGLDAALMGQEIAVDTDEGKLPIIELSGPGSTMLHGLRACEASDDHYAPRARQDDTIRYHHARSMLLREWYYNNPEYLTGTTTIVPAMPDIAPGTAIEIPYESWFRQASMTNEHPRKVFPVDRIVGYVVGATDDLVVSQTGQVDGQTSVSWIRGQPISGLPVPNQDRWL
jgi:hypothetical protein